MFTVPIPMKNLPYNIVYAFGRGVILIFRRLFLNYRIRYTAPLPDGAKIYILNHPTTIDPFLAFLMTKEKSYVLIWDTIFKVPIAGWFIHYLKHIPVNPDKGIIAYRQAVDYLRQGKSVIIFPEGGLSECAETFSMLKSGCIRMASETGAPIVPIGIGLFWKNIKRYPSQKDGTLLNTSLYSGPYAMTVGQPVYIPGTSDRTKIKIYSEQLSGNINALMALSFESVDEIQHRLNVIRAVNKAFSFTLYQIIFFIHFIK